MAAKKEKPREEVSVPESNLPPQPTKAVSDLLAKKLALQAKSIKKMGAAGCLASEMKPPSFYPTGLPVMDKEVLGLGGLPKGRIIEVYGPKSAGKTAVTLHLAANVQKVDQAAIVKIYDREHSCTIAWLTSMGLDLNRTLVIGSPDIGLNDGTTHALNAEEMAEMIHADIAMGELAPDIIVIDSIAVIQTESVMETAIEDRSMRDNLARAAFLTDFFNTLTDGFHYPYADPKTKKLPADSKKWNLGMVNTTLMCINHAKQRTVKAGANTYTEWYSVGGVALDFHACIQLMCKRVGFEKGTDGNVSHQRISVCADKNKVAPPKRSCELLLSFKGGIEQVGSIDWLTIALNKGLAKKSGSWIESAIFLAPKGKVQGEEAFNKAIEASPEFQKLLAD